MCAKSSTRISAAMAIAATWVISTARSPTTWQPNILQVARSTISLQKPTLRPSMIVRVVESKRITAVMTSCVSRAFASVRPTWEYSGSVKLPIGFSQVRVIEIVVHFGFVLPKKLAPVELRLFALILQSMVVVLWPFSHQFRLALCQYSTLLSWPIVRKSCRFPLTNQKISTIG
jgi:hypothetical protein